VIIYNKKASDQNQTTNDNDNIFSYNKDFIYSDDFFNTTTVAIKQATKFSNDGNGVKVYQLVNATENKFILHTITSLPENTFSPCLQKYYHKYIEFKSYEDGEFSKCIERIKNYIKDQKEERARENEEDEKYRERARAPENEEDEKYRERAMESVIVKEREWEIKTKKEYENSILQYNLVKIKERPNVIGGETETTNNSAKSYIDIPLILYNFYLAIMFNFDQGDICTILITLLMIIILLVIAFNLYFLFVFCLRKMNECRNNVNKFLKL